MFQSQRTIFLRETDATGVLYFSELLKFGLECFEDFLLSKGFTLQEMIDGAEFLLPIVHAEADFKQPIRVGDQVEIELFLQAVGTSSFTLHTAISDDRGLLGTTKIVHVAISKKSKSSIPLPQQILTHLRDLRVLERMH